VDPQPLDITLQPLDNRRLANLCGALDENLRQIETAFDVSIRRRGEHFSLRGTPSLTRLAGEALQRFYEQADQTLSVEDVQLGLIEVARKREVALTDPKGPVLLTRRADLHGRTPRQVHYLSSIQ
jgi:phosphate starvation-inducible PhoH-like protein